MDTHTFNIRNNSNNICFSARTLRSTQRSLVLGPRSWLLSLYTLHSFVGLHWIHESFVLHPLPRMSVCVWVWVCWVFGFNAALWLVCFSALRLLSWFEFAFPFPFPVRSMAILKRVMSWKSVTPAI